MKIGEEENTGDLGCVVDGGSKFAKCVILGCFILIGDGL
jgi:hypothetical protein